jgi:hypothetical protein
MDFFAKMRFSPTRLRKIQRYTVFTYLRRDDLRIWLQVFQSTDLVSDFSMSITFVLPQMLESSFRRDRILFFLSNYHK